MKIVKHFRLQEFKPEIVVCLGRGGCVFGGLLAGNLGIIPIIGIDREVINKCKE
jgi:hypoxanthine phosphoribosyltransferase